MIDTQGEENLLTLTSCTCGKANEVVAVSTPWSSSCGNCRVEALCGPSSMERSSIAAPIRTDANLDQCPDKLPQKALYLGLTCRKRTRVAYKISKGKRSCFCAYSWSALACKEQGASVLCPTLALQATVWHARRVLKRLICFFLLRARIHNCSQELVLDAVGTRRSAQPGAADGRLRILCPYTRGLSEVWSGGSICCYVCLLHRLLIRLLLCAAAGNESGA